MDKRQKNDVDSSLNLPNYDVQKKTAENKIV